MRRSVRTILACIAVVGFVALVMLSAWPFGARGSLSAGPADGASPATAPTAAGSGPPAANAASAGPTALPLGALPGPDDWSGGLLPKQDSVQAGAESAPGRAPAAGPAHWTTGRRQSCGVGMSAVLVLVSLGLVSVAGTTLWWMLHAWRTPESLKATGFRRLKPHTCGPACGVTPFVAGQAQACARTRAALHR